MIGVRSGYLAKIGVGLGYLEIIDVFDKLMHSLFYRNVATHGGNI